MKQFIKELAERALKTFAQSLLAYTSVTGVAFGDIDWPLALSVSGVATLTSILTSIASYNIGDKGTPSVV